MNIPSNPSSSLSFPFGDPSAVQAGLTAAGTAATTAGSAVLGTVEAVAAAVAPVAVIIAGGAVVGYAVYKTIKWLGE